MKRVCVRNILSVCDCTCLSKFGHVFHPFIRRSMSIDVIAGNNDDDDEVKEDVPWSSPLVHPFWSMVRSIASDRIIFRGCVIKFDLYSTDHCRRLQWSSSCRGHFPTRHTRRRRRARGHSNWPSHPSPFTNDRCRDNQLTWPRVYHKVEKRIGNNLRGEVQKKRRRLFGHNGQASSWSWWT